MNESDLLERLRLLTDPPVEPPGNFRDHLLNRLRTELDTASPGSVTIGPIFDLDDDMVIAASSSNEHTLDRHPLLAAAAAFVLVAGVVALLSVLWPGGSNQPATTSTTNEVASLSIPGPLQLSTGDILWPPTDTAGTSTSVALLFAEQVLGWNQATAVATETGTCLTIQVDRTVCSMDTTSVLLTQPGVASISVTMRSIGNTDTGTLWAVAQVGSGYPTDLLETAPGIGTRISLPAVEGAVEADIGLTIANHESPTEIIFTTMTATSENLASGFVDTDTVPDGERVVNIFIRYRDSSSHIITATGGPFNHSYQWSRDEPVGEEVIIAEGINQGQPWKLSAFYTTSSNLCVRLGGMACVTDPRLSPHVGVLMTATIGTEPASEWCAFGLVREAAAVELRLPDGSTKTAAIYTSPDFGVEFFAYCDVGRRPTQAVGLDSAGTVIDTP